MHSVGVSGGLNSLRLLLRRTEGSVTQCQESRETLRTVFLRYLHKDFE